MSFDPRWGGDPRDDGSDARRDRSERSRDHHEDFGPDLGRGPSSQKDHSDVDTRHRDDERAPDRGRDPRSQDPRDVFTRHVDLPRGRDREIVHDAREREYTLRGSESRTLAIVGSLRVVSARDLRGHNDRAADRHAVSADLVGADSDDLVHEYKHDVFARLLACLKPHRMTYRTRMT